MSPALTPKPRTPLKPRKLLTRRQPEGISDLVRKPTDPKILAERQRSRQIWWDGKFDGYWRVLLGPLNWANPERAGAFPSESTAVSSAQVSSERGRWAKVFDPNGKLIASFDKTGKRNDGGDTPVTLPRKKKPLKPAKRR